MSDWCEFLLLCGYGLKCTDGIDYRSTVKYRDAVTFRGVLSIPNVRFGMMSIGNTDNYTVFSIFSHIKSTFMWFEIHFMRCVVGRYVHFNFCRGDEYRGCYFKFNVLTKPVF